MNSAAELPQRLMADVVLDRGTLQLPPEKLVAWLEELGAAEAGVAAEAPTQLVALALTLQEKWPGQCDVLLDQLMALAVSVVADGASVKQAFAEAGVDIATIAAVTGFSDSRIPVGARAGARGSSVLEVALGNKRDSRRGHPAPRKAPRGHPAPRK